MQLSQQSCLKRQSQQCSPATYKPLNCIAAFLWHAETGMPNVETSQEPETLHAVAVSLLCPSLTTNGIAVQSTN